MAGNEYRVCQFCRHWQPVENDGGMVAAKAECRRFPPVPAYIDGNMETIFPWTTADTSCSEWEQQSVDQEVSRTTGRVMAPKKKRKPK